MAEPTIKHVSLREPEGREPGPFGTVIGEVPLEMAEPLEKAPAEPPETTAEVPGEGEETSVPVLSASLNRIAGLAGECLGQARLTGPFSSTLLKSKTMLMDLAGDLEEISRLIQRKRTDRGIKERLGESLSRIDDIRNLIGEHMEGFGLFTRNLGRLTDQLYNEALEITMRSFSDGTLRAAGYLVVEIGGEPYAIPLARIDRVSRVAGEKIEVLENKRFYTWENEHLGIVDAREVLGVAGR